MKKYWQKYWRAGLSMLMVGLIFLGWQKWPKNKQVVLSPEAPWIQVEKPLEKYSFTELRKTVFNGSEIKKEKVLFKKDGYTAWLFSFKAEGGKITGQMNVPLGEVPAGGWPVVVMIRGYADKEIYQTGVGTRNAAGYFAGHGFITLAPDFLGYGESDSQPNNSLQERFMRPMQVLELIASVKNIKNADVDKISIWGHSNGGQIALSVLEISGKSYSTSLWAPVSKPFPTHDRAIPLP